jgi:hypothetical protein
MLRGPVLLRKRSQLVVRHRFLSHRVWSLNGSIEQRCRNAFGGDDAFELAISLSDP